MRGRNIVQMLKAVDMLSQPGGTTINRMSESLGIDRRNVYRLLDIIQDLGFPLYDDKQGSNKEKLWKLDAEYLLKLPNITVPDIRLNFSEIIALYLLRAESSLYSGTEIESRINFTFSKLSQFVPKDFQVGINKLKSLFVPSGKWVKDYSGKEEIIDLLTTAMLNNKTCLVSYFSFVDDKVKKFRIDPLYFFESNGGLYIFIRATRFNNIRILAVERIEALEKLDETFEYPEDFDPAEKLSMAFDFVYDDPVELEVIFCPAQAKYIKERKFSPDQKIIDSTDGSVTLKMTTSGWYDIKKWLLSFGPEVLVVKPEKLKEEMLNDLQIAIDNYKNVSD
ncbi:helix-turn-helix transcriptional regulator [Desulfonatronovibrio magnus]|uniref:helix-turn-helix transcriptional regulator n=1 Tax=Desulfonatronovibrio magnus TaxID=698827 RepID=UPI0005EBD761|nr:WYL domain-containing protein [Desulfonatronovibrio magnus]